LRSASRLLCNLLIIVLRDSLKIISENTKTISASIKENWGCKSGTKKDKHIAEIKKLQAEISYKIRISGRIRKRSGNIDKPNPIAKATMVLTCPIRIEKTR
jgi:hypothetical protein